MAGTTVSSSTDGGRVGAVRSPRFALDILQPPNPQDAERLAPRGGFALNEQGLLDLDEVLQADPRALGAVTAMRTDGVVSATFQVVALGPSDAAKIASEVFGDAYLRVRLEGFEIVHLEITLAEGENVEAA